MKWFSADQKKAPAASSVAVDPKAAVEPVLPVPIPHTQARFARGMRAGRWLFATGLSGTDYAHGMAPEVLQAQHPLNGVSQAKRESRRLFGNLQEVLAQAGAGFPDVVRIDQYYVGAHAVDPYHEVRREVFQGRIPPSTSNLHQRLALTGQMIEVQAMAAVPGSGLEVEHQSFQPSYRIHHSSGYSPGLRAGDFRFIPGQTAEARREEDAPIDLEARRPPGLWKGTPIKLETEFIIRRKLQPSLEAAGAGLESVVKAQVYLRDRDDVPMFNEVWLAHFPDPPATTIVATATPGFIMPDSRIEINTIALATGGATRKEVVQGPEAPLFDGYVSAIRSGDLLFLSGLMATQADSLTPEALPDPAQPFFGIPVKAELRAIARQAEAICQAAGTTLANAVRIQQFHTDLADLPAAIEVWDEVLGRRPLPLSAIEVPWLPVPGARVLVDLWVYAP
jgi:enamine deaminase RidA (YjgF/YER057c/UK114 family)